MSLTHFKFWGGVLAKERQQNKVSRGWKKKKKKTFEWDKEFEGKVNEFHCKIRVRVGKRRERERGERKLYKTKNNVIGKKKRINWEELIASE